jgi:hypothetical protein
MEGRRGRPCLDILDVVRKDFSLRNLIMKLRNFTGFEDHKFLALDTKEWKKVEVG